MVIHFLGRVIFCAFSISSCGCTVVLVRVIFSFLLLAVVVIQSFYLQELSSHFFLLAVVVIQSFYLQELSAHFFLLAVVVIHFYCKSYLLIFYCGQLWLYIFIGKSYLLTF